MKKIILSLVLLAGITSTSCKKSYNCTCYDINGNTSSSTIITASSTTSAQSTCTAKGANCLIQ